MKIDHVKNTETEASGHFSTHISLSHMLCVPSPLAPVSGFVTRNGNHQGTRDINQLYFDFLRTSTLNYVTAQNATIVNSHLSLPTLSLALYSTTLPLAKTQNMYIYAGYADTNMTSKELDRSAVLGASYSLSFGLALGVLPTRPHLRQNGSDPCSSSTKGSSSSSVMVDDGKLP